MSKIIVGNIFNGAFIIRKFEYADMYGYIRYVCMCECEKEFIKTSKNIKRTKTNKCSACKKLDRQKLIKKAAIKIRPYMAPDFKSCKSCFITKKYSEFPKGIHTCIKCHNIGRGAYYHLSINNNMETKNEQIKKT